MFLCFAFLSAPPPPLCCILAARSPQPEASLLVFHLSSHPLVPTAPGDAGWALALSLLTQDPHSPEWRPATI